MNTLTRIWTTINTPPPSDAAVEVRFSDGTSSLLLWNGSRWFPPHPNKTAIAWRLVPELEDLHAFAS